MPNVIADIAGEYQTLLALLKKMTDDEVISLGDMVDRGADSAKVQNPASRPAFAVFATRNTGGQKFRREAR